MPREGRVPESALRFSKEFAGLIRQEREFRGWSQTELAERMQHLGYKWSQRIVSNIETGERDLNVIEVMALSWAFGLHVTELIGPQNLAAFQANLRRRIKSN